MLEKFGNPQADEPARRSFARASYSRPAPSASPVVWDVPFDPEAMDQVSTDGTPNRFFNRGNERLYEAYSQLHNMAQEFDKPFDSPAILVVGHQTDGKSALVEALMGFQFNHVGGGTKTRRPIAINMKYNATCVEPRCFLLRDDNYGREEEMTLPDLQRYIESENQRLENDNGFWAKDIVVKIEYKYCPNLTIIDTPGLIAAAPGRKHSGIQQAARSVETLVRAKMQQKDYIILCLEDNSDWNNATTRRVVLDCDPELRRTVVVSTKFDTRIPQFSRASDVEFFMKPPPGFSSPPFSAAARSSPRCPPAASAAPATVSSAATNSTARLCSRRRSATRPSSSADATAACSPPSDPAWASPSSDTSSSVCSSSATSRTSPPSSPSSSANTAPPPSSSARRTSSSRTSTRINQGERPRVLPALPGEDSRASSRYDGGAPRVLRRDARARAHPSGAFVGPDGRPMDMIAPVDVPNADMRLFGGAQYHRALEEFRATVGAVECPVVSREDIINSCGVDEVHDGVNYTRTACVIAVARAKETFEPYVHQLGFRLAHIARRLLPVAMYLLQKEGRS